MFFTGQQLKFKSDSGMTLDGIVIEHNDVAARVSSIVGMYSISASAVIWAETLSDISFNDDDEVDAREIFKQARERLEKRLNHNKK